MTTNENNSFQLNDIIPDPGAYGYEDEKSISVELSSLDSIFSSISASSIVSSEYSTQSSTCESSRSSGRVTGDDSSDDKQKASTENYTPLDMLLAHPMDRSNIDPNVYEVYDNERPSTSIKETSDNSDRRPKKQWVYKGFKGRSRSYEVPIQKRDICSKLKRSFHRSTTNSKKEDMIVSIETMYVGLLYIGEIFSERFFVTNSIA